MGNVLGNNPADCSTERQTEGRTEEELWVEYRQTRNPKLRDGFIMQYAPLVKYVAGKLAVGKPPNVEFDDLVGFGVFGLIDAIDKFDPEKNVKFKTYAVTRIRGAIYDELRAIDWVPRSVRQKSREVESAVGSLEAQLGRTATDQEIAESMGMSEDEYFRTLMKIAATSIISINDVWFSGDDNDRTSIGDSIESPARLNPDVIVEREEMRNVIINAINELPPKEKMVLVLYYYEDATLKEIGQVLHVTESRVSQLHTRAILRLRAKLTNVRKGIV
ncbi:MAG: RNA polymerase sigma factor WhiG [Treponema sp.]|jgi:RNA polymerase sigma factor for flagellar operon FliA|nr:RNA polymerase sigma factor WhiG [Treponema sp.]